MPDWAEQLVQLGRIGLRSEDASFGCHCTQHGLASARRLSLRRPTGVCCQGTIEFGLRVVVA